MYELVLYVEAKLHASYCCEIVWGSSAAVRLLCTGATHLLHYGGERGGERGRSESEPGE